MAVFSTEQQPGSVLVALMGERGNLLCTKGGEHPLKATFCCLKPLGHVVSMRNNWSSWQLKVKAAFFIRSCSGALVPAQCQQPPLYNSVFMLIVQDYSLLTAVVFCWLIRKTKKHHPQCPKELLNSITPSFCSLSSPPFFVNFMDLSANGLPPHCPSHIWHLSPSPNQPLLFLVSSPVALSGRSVPAAEEGGGSIPFFTLLTGQLLSLLTWLVWTPDLIAVSLLVYSIT